MSVVVVAENDPDALDLALTDLRLEGHEVHGARDAAEAEALIAAVRAGHRRARPPDAAGRDGPGPGRAAGREHPAVRVVMYSNYRSAELTARAEAIGVPFLAKGNLAALRAAVSP